MRFSSVLMTPVVSRNAATPPFDADGPSEPTMLYWYDGLKICDAHAAGVSSTAASPVTSPTVAMRPERDVRRLRGTAIATKRTTETTASTIAVGSSQDSKFGNWEDM